MAGYRNLDELRAAVPETLRGLDDADLVREYAVRARVPLDEALNFFGVAPSGTLDYLGDTIGQGANDAKQMAGRGLQYADRELGLGGSATGAEWEAEARAAEHQWTPDDRNRWGVTKFAGAGLRAAVPMVPALAGMVVGSPVALGAAAVGSAALFGSSEAESAFRDVYEATGNEEAAYAAARRVGALHGVGEAGATLAGGAVMKAGRAALGTGARAATTAGVAAEATARPGLAALGKTMGLNYATQIGTEVAQDVGTNEIVEAYGGEARDNWATAKDSAYGAAALTTLLAPFGIGGHISRGRQADQLKEALFGDTNDATVRERAMVDLQEHAKRNNIDLSGMDPELAVDSWLESRRTNAIDVIMGEAQRQKVDPADIDSWFEKQLQDMDKTIADNTAADQAAWSAAEAVNARPAPPPAPVPAGQQEIDLLGGATATPYTPAPGVDTTTAAPGFNPAQGDMLAEPASPQMGLGLERGAGTQQGSAVEAALRAEQRPAPEVAPGGLNLRQTDMLGGVNPVYDAATSPAVDTQRLLPAPAPSPVMVASADGTVRPTTFGELAAERATQLRAMRDRVTAQDGAAIPAGAPALQVDPASATQIPRPRAAAPVAPAAPAAAAPAAAPVVRRNKEGRVTSVTVPVPGGQPRTITKLGRMKSAGMTDAEVIARVAPEYAAPAAANPTGLSPAAVAPAQVERTGADRRQTDTPQATERRTGARRLPTPHDLLVEDFEATEATAPEEERLTPAQRARHMPKANIDSVTGWHNLQGRRDLLERWVAAAQRHAEETGESVHYLSFDLQNLGGLNAFFNDVADDANKHYRAIMDIMKAEMSKVGHDIDGARTGGDELSALVTGGTAAEIEAAANRAWDKIAAYTRKHGFGDIKHAKGKPVRGVNVYAGVGEIRPGQDPSTLINAADAAMGIKKQAAIVAAKKQKAAERAAAKAAKEAAKEGKTDVDREPAGEAGVERPEGRAGRGDSVRPAAEAPRAAGAAESAGAGVRAEEAAPAVTPAPKKTRAKVIKEKVAETGSAKTTPAEREAPAPAFTPAKTDRSVTSGMGAVLARQRAADAHIKDIITQANATDIDPDTLQGARRGEDSRVVAGKTRMPQDSLLRVRDAVIAGNSNAKGLSKEESTLVAKVLAFQRTYSALTDMAGNWWKTGFAREDASAKLEAAGVISAEDSVTAQENRITRLFGRTQIDGRDAPGMGALADDMQVAFGGLVDAAKGNAKDIEAIVRLVKDAVQQELAAEPDTDGEGEVDEDAAKARAKEIRSLDTMLSRAWGAAKRGVFSGSTTDLADVRPGSVRDSAEAKAQADGPTPLQRRAQGRAGKKADPLTGAKGTTTRGIIALLSELRVSGTPMEKQLASALKRAFESSKREPTLVFGKKASYDPKTNTITLDAEASPEIILHEALHGALQWYVYGNPSSQAVAELKKSLNTVMNWKLPLDPKAEQVRAELKKLLGQGRELDAVLELVSYGTTMNAFRKALQSMEGTAPNRGFYAAMQNVWRWLTITTQRLLGTNNTVASNVLDSTMKLLEESTRAKEAGVDTAAGKAGKPLQAAVDSRTPAPPRRRGLRSPIASISDQDYRAFTESPSAAKSPMQIAFEALGFGDKGATSQKVRETGAKLAEKIRKDYPTLERHLLTFNSKFSNGVLANSAIDKFKDDRNTGYMQMERIATYLDAHPELAKPFLAFMDGNAKALDGMPDGGKLKSAAASMSKLFDRYVSTLPPGSAEQRFFQDNKFSDYLLFAGNVKQVAGTTFGVKKLSDMIGTETRTEPTLEGFVQAGWLRADADGVVDTNDRMLQVLQPDADGKLVPAGFISQQVFDTTGTPAGYSVDPSRIWRMEAYRGGFKFVTSRTAKQAVAERKINELTTAMLNTTAALSHTFASRNYLDAMAQIGWENGAPTAGAVAFDSVDQINAAFPGRQLDEKQVLQVSDDASKSEEVRAAAQRTGVWVKLPGSAKEPGSYGALAGKYVSGPVWNSMLDMHDRAPWSKYRMLNGSMRVFKKAKTVYNPGTHVTNVATNVTLAYMHGIPMGTVKAAAKLLARYELRPASLTPAELAKVQAFLDSGAMLGEFSSTEVKKTIYDALIDNITPRSDESMLSKLAAWAKIEEAKAKLSRADDVVTAAYAAEDNAFRLAAFLKVAGDIQYRDKAASLSEAQLKEAGLAARKMFLDYDIDARGIRALRQTVLPFVSWTYAIMPVLGRMALTQPWKIANVLAAYAILAGLTDDDDDREAAPEYIRDRAFGVGPYMHMRIPFLGSDEAPVFVNLGRYVPMFSLLQPPPGETKVAGIDWIPGFATPGGPFVSVVIALMAGEDPFTGKDLRPITSSTAEKVGETTRALYDAFAPGMISSSTIKDAQKLAAGPDAEGNEPSALFMLRKFGGIGMYQFDEAQSEEKQERAAGAIRREFEKAMRKARQVEEAKGYPDYEALDAELDALRARMEEEVGKVDPEAAEEVEEE